ncbi:MAG TPA: hypothetical protein VN113_11270 [Caulobacter sp.]|nr:hypothetical protein [Caulobacter sp.]
MRKKPLAAYDRFWRRAPVRLASSFEDPMALPDIDIAIAGDRNAFLDEMVALGQVSGRFKAERVSNALGCQTAFKTDPRSASNIDPSSLCSRTGGEARSGQLAQRVAA